MILSRETVKALKLNHSALRTKRKTCFSLIFSELNFLDLKNVLDKRSLADVCTHLFGGIFEIFICFVNNTISTILKRRHNHAEI